jgi:hypothetical protein
MELREAFVRNIINSPFVSLNSDGTETAITENYLYFIHLQRNDSPLPHFRTLAELFGKAISRTTNQEEEIWRQEYLFKYEQYFARIELLNKILMSEAKIRQLIHSHLKAKLNKDDITKYKLISETDNIISGIKCFLRHIVNEEYNNRIEPNFPIDKFNRMIDRIETVFIEPLITIRNGICHGNMRAYIDGLRKNIPQITSVKATDCVGRAQMIFEHIDARLFYILSQNLQLFCGLCYCWLVEYQENETIKGIVFEARQRKMELDVFGTFLETTWRRYPHNETVKLLKNKQIKEACTIPLLQIEEFIRSC